DFHACGPHHGYSLWTIRALDQYKPQGPQVQEVVFVKIMLRRNQGPKVVARQFDLRLVPLQISQDTLHSVAVDQGASHLYNQPPVEQGHQKVVQHGTYQLRFPSIEDPESGNVNIRSNLCSMEKKA